MPLYEYICQQCGRHTEKIQSFSAPPLTVCPHCGGELKQAISAPAVQFKGSGWYVNDYAKSGASKKASQKSEGESISASSGDSGSKEASGSESKSDSAKPSGSTSATSNAPAKSE